MNDIHLGGRLDEFDLRLRAGKHLLNQLPVVATCHDGDAHDSPG